MEDAPRRDFDSMKAWGHAITRRGQVDNGGNLEPSKKFEVKVDESRFDNKAGTDIHRGTLHVKVSERLATHVLSQSHAAVAHATLLLACCSGMQVRHCKCLHTRHPPAHPPSHTCRSAELVQCA